MLTSIKKMGQLKLKNIQKTQFVFTRAKQYFSYLILP